VKITQVLKIYLSHICNQVWNQIITLETAIKIVAKETVTKVG